MNKLTATTLAIALCAGYTHAQALPEHIIWSDPITVAPVISQVPGDVNIIRDDQLPEGGVKKTYLADFNYASISSYGVTWVHDTDLAMYIYWTDSDVAYVKNLSTMGDAWVMAFVQDNTLWVPTGADIMVSSTGTLYQLITGTVNMKNNSFEMRTGIKFTMNDDRTEIEMEPSPDNKNVLGFFTMNVEEGKILQAYSKIKMTEFTAQPVLPPDNADFKRYEYSTMLGGYQPWTNRSWIAFDGDDVYVQGLEWISPESWVKGAMMSDKSIRIPTGQFLKINGNYPIYYYAAVYEGDFMEDNVRYTDRSAFFLNYDETTGGYQMADNECFISGKDKATGFPVISGKFVPFDAKPGTPQTAEDLDWDQELGLFKFHIPMTDTGGNQIDYYMLRYSIYVNGKKYTFTPANSPLYNEEIDEMPGNQSYYLYTIETDYMFGRNDGDIYVVPIQIDEPIESLGVSMTYNVLGDERSSELASIKVVSVSEIENSEKEPVAYFGMDGRQLTNPTGIYMVRYSDGTVEKKFSHR